MNNGIYYLIGAPIKLDPEKFFVHPDRWDYVVYFEVHKLENVNFDEDHEYCPIEESAIKGLKLSELVSGGYNPYTRENIPFRFRENLEFYAGPLGLDALNDLFGKRMTVIQLTKDSAFKEENAANYLYKVVVKDVAQNDWYNILILLDKFSGRELGLLGNSRNLLDRTLLRLRQNLETYEKMEQNIGK